MGELRRETVIEVDTSSVYNYVADPRNAPNFIASITRIVDGPEGNPDVGQSWRAEANFLGQERAITLTLDELKLDRLVCFELRGDTDATITVALEPVGGPRAGSTAVTLLLKVPSVPGILLSGVMGNVLTSDLARLKRTLEN